MTKHLKTWNAIDGLCVCGREYGKYYRVGTEALVYRWDTGGYPLATRLDHGYFLGSLAGYLQCFVHLAEGPLPPHVHVAGACLTSRAAWRKAVAAEILIPRAGHRGFAIPVGSLHPFAALLNFGDRKF